MSVSKTDPIKERVFASAAAAVVAFVPAMAIAEKPSDIKRPPPPDDQPGGRPLPRR